MSHSTIVTSESDLNKTQIFFYTRLDPSSVQGFQQDFIGSEQLTDVPLSSKEQYQVGAVFEVAFERVAEFCRQVEMHPHLAALSVADDTALHNLSVFLRTISNREALLNAHTVHNLFNAVINCASDEAVLAVAARLSELDIRL